MYIKPYATKWHRGPPPDIGWWPASLMRDPKRLRYWDGKGWSVFVEHTSTAEEASQRAATVWSVGADSMVWTDRWWLDDVPRQDLEVQRAFKLLRSRGFRV